MSQDEKRPKSKIPLTPPIARGPALDILMDTLHEQDQHRRVTAAMERSVLVNKPAGRHAKARGTKAERAMRLEARRKREKKQKRRHRKLNKRGKRR